VNAANAASDAIAASFKEITTLRRNLNQNKSIQVRSNEELCLIKATVAAWLNIHRPAIGSLLDNGVLEPVDQLYNKIDLASYRATSRKTYDNDLKILRKALMAVKDNSFQVLTQQAAHTADDPPDFSSLTLDARMQAILASRWEECCICLSAKASLAATVMIGGLLEALLLARFNKESDKEKIHTAKTAPNAHTGKGKKKLTDWTLSNYIDVAHELKWISESAKDVSTILRKYRNLIHPARQLSNQTELTTEEPVFFWELSKNIARELLK